MTTHNSFELLFMPNITLNREFIPKNYKKQIITM
jgi:hypothetical protein